MSNVNFAIPDFCSVIPNVLALAGNFLAGLHWKRQNVLGMSGNHRSDFREPVCGLIPGCRLSGSWELLRLPPKTPLHRWFAMLLSARSLGPPWLRAGLEDSWLERQRQTKAQARSQTQPDHGGAPRKAN